MDDVNQHKAPPILTGMVDTITREMIAAEIEPIQAREIALRAVDKIREVYSGDRVYMPKGHQLAVNRKDRRIWDDFDGFNKFFLSKKYDMTVRGIEKAIARVRAEEDRLVQGALDF